MIQSRTKGFYNAVAIALCLALTATFWIFWAFLNFVFHGSRDMRPDLYASYNLVAVIGLLIQLVHSDGSRMDIVSRDVFRSAKQGLEQALYVGGALMATLLLTQDLNISRLFLFTFIPLNAIVLGLANAIIPMTLSRMFFQGRHELKVLFVGPSRRVKRMHVWARHMARFGLRVAGILANDTARKTVLRIPVLGGIDDLDHVLVSEEISLVVMLAVPDDEKVLRQIGTIPAPPPILSPLRHRFHGNAARAIAGSIGSIL
jgi:FlaA1/EpsC-like NDP-sugar epimerase